jgi:ribosomal protein S18 acetylase RimI-like enzyme
MAANIEIARVEDAPEILALQKLAYREEAELYDDWAIPPLIQTLEQLQVDFGGQVFLKAVEEDRLIGSVRAYQQEGTCYIGRLIVHPDFQGRGIGTRLMQEIEAAFPQARRYELFTGERSTRNLHLYHKLGYIEFRRQALSEKVTLVLMEKPGPVS